MFNFKSDKDLYKFILTHNYYGSASENTIEGYIVNVRKIYHQICDDLNSIRYAANTLKEWNIGFNSEYDKAITELEDQAKISREHLELINKYTQEKQEECKHVWHEDGHDSHHVYYLCNICGAEDKD